MPRLKKPKTRAKRSQSVTISKIDLEIPDEDKSATVPQPPKKKKSKSKLEQTINYHKTGTVTLHNEALAQSLIFNEHFPAANVEQKLNTKESLQNQIQKAIQDLNNSVEHDQNNLTKRIAELRAKIHVLQNQLSAWDANASNNKKIFDEMQAFLNKEQEKYILMHYQGDSPLMRCIFLQDDVFKICPKIIERILFAGKESSQNDKVFYKNVIKVYCAVNFTNPPFSLENYNQLESLIENLLNVSSSQISVKPLKLFLEAQQFNEEKIRKIIQFIWTARQSKSIEAFFKTGEERGFFESILGGKNSLFAIYKDCLKLRAHFSYSEEQKLQMFKERNPTGYVELFVMQERIACAEENPHSLYEQVKDFSYEEKLFDAFVDPTHFFQGNVKNSFVKKFEPEMQKLTEINTETKKTRLHIAEQLMAFEENCDRQVKTLKAGDSMQVNMLKMNVLFAFERYKIKRDQGFISILHTQLGLKKAQKLIRDLQYKNTWKDCVAVLVRFLQQENGLHDSSFTTLLLEEMYSKERGGILSSRRMQNGEIDFAESVKKFNQKNKEFINVFMRAYDYEQEDAISESMQTQRFIDEHVPSMYASALNENLDKKVEKRMLTQYFERIERQRELVNDFKNS